MFRDRQHPGRATRFVPWPPLRHGTLLLLLLATIAAPLARAEGFTRGDLLLVTRATASDRIPRLVELTPSGSVVQTIEIPAVGDDDPRDLAVDGQGRAHVFNGMFDPYLSTFDPRTGTWQHHTYPGWSIIGNGTYGGIAVTDSFVFVTDQRTFGPGDLPSGLVRFDLRDFSAIRFADGSDYIQLTLGGDGLLYGLAPSGSPGGTVAEVWDPATLTRVRTVSLPSYQGLRALAVDSAGTIFAIGLNSGAYRYSPSGVLQKHVTTHALLGTYDYLQDIDLGPNGRLVIGTDYGGVGIGDVTLDPAAMHFIQFPFGFAVSATFVPNHAPDCSGARPSVSGLWPPDHRMVPVRLLGLSDADGDSLTLTYTVTQNEAVDATGSGRTCPDARVTDDGQLYLRAERSGEGSGRVYDVHFVASDGRGGRCEGDFAVSVPHDRGRDHARADEATSNDSMAACVPTARSGVTAADEAGEASPPLSLEVLSLSRSQAVFRYGLPSEAQVRLELFDVLGRRVAALENARERAGTHQRSWNLQGARNGIYYCRLRSDLGDLTRSVLVLR